MNHRTTSQEAPASGQQEAESAATSHTPTPWGYGNTGSDQIMIVGGPRRAYVCTVRIEQVGGGAIAHAMEPERRANAALIVKAVNNHDALVKALEQTQKDLGIVLAALRSLEEATGEAFDDEGGIVTQIERDYAARASSVAAAR